MGHFFSVGKFDRKNISVSEMSRKKYSVLIGLCALKNIVFVEEKKCRENVFLLRCEAEKIFLTPKKP